MDIPRRYWRNLDIPLLLAVLALILLGIIAIYSASAGRLLSNNDNPFYYARKQAIWTMISFAVMCVVVTIDYRAWKRWSGLGYIVCLILLLLVLVGGRIRGGAQSWFSFGVMNMQPSELAKIIMIVVLASYLDKNPYLSGRKILIPFALIGVPMLLIFAQPDLGTAMVFVGIIFSMVYLAGGNAKKLVLIGGAGGLVGLTAILLSYFEIVEIIKPYQLKRILVFIDPYSDPTGFGWNIIQSMIAVGSGGFMGKGFLNGTQSQLSFLPANHTDFIFSAIAEEFGFIGVTIIFVLYGFIIWRGLRIASVAKDRYGMLLAGGCISLFVSHIIINIGMTIGVMPVTGIPLPFLSYGGSTLLTNMITVGVLLNVGLRRQKIMF